MNVEILGTIKARRFRFSIQILETKTQRKFVDPCFHSLSDGTTAQTLKNLFSQFSIFHNILKTFTLPAE